MGTRCWARWSTTVPANTAPKTSRSPSRERRFTQLVVSSRCAVGVTAEATEAGFELFSDNAPSFGVQSGSRKHVANGGCRANQQIWTFHFSPSVLDLSFVNQRLARGCSQELLKANEIIDTVGKHWKSSMPGGLAAGPDARPSWEDVCQPRASSPASTRLKTSRRSSTCGSRRSMPWYGVVSSRLSSSEDEGSGGSTAFSSRTTSSECTRRHGNGRSRIRSPGVREKSDDRDRRQRQDASTSERRLTTSLSKVVLRDLEVVVSHGLDGSRGVVAIGEFQTHRLPTAGEFS